MAYRWADCYDHKMLTYRRAVLGDLKELCKFTDWWLAGRGKRQGVTGAVDDCFITPGQHRKYICRYLTWVCCDGYKIVGWAVVERSDTMIHLLVASNYRGKGIGTMLLSYLSPRFIRSKLDQSSGNPIGFYEKLGYRKVATVKSRSRIDIDEICPSRDANIDVLEYVG